MNRALPPRDRGYRDSAISWAHRSRRALLGACGLVGGVADSPGTTETRKAAGVESGVSVTAEKCFLASQRISALPALGLCGYDGQAHLLAKRAGDESANAVRLPAGRFHDPLQRDPTFALHQGEDRFGLAALARALGLGFARVRLLLAGGLLSRLLPDRALCRASVR